MYSLLREGASLIVIGTEKENILLNILEKEFSSTKGNLVEMLENAEEEDTILVITDPGKKIARLDEVKASLLIKLPSYEVLCRIINLRLCSFLNDCRIAPGILLMRVMGNFENILNSLKETYKCEVLSLTECLDKGGSDQTIISFTEKPLKHKVHISDLKQKHLLVNMDKNSLYKKIRIQALRFLNEGLLGTEWYDLYIRIYDRYGKYKLHFERLAEVLEGLELGLILGESWTKDYPRPLLSVMVYQIRLFTLLQPVEIKKVLLALEYSADGERICDLDLYFKNIKIDWPQVLQKVNKNYTRKDFAIIMRKEILENLEDNSKEKVLKLEEEILKMRF